MTLPHDTLEYLHEVDPDLGWAIVKVTDAMRQDVTTRSFSGAAPPDVELVAIAERQFLIVVRQDAFVGLPHVSLVPLGHGRAFLAFPPGRTVDTLELVLTDQLQAGTLPAAEYAHFVALRDILRQWRHDASLRFHERSIVVVEHVPAGPPRRRPAGRRETRR